MPWVTPTLPDLRALARDNVSSGLNGGAPIPNSALRVLTDGNSGLAYLVLKYIDWLSLQLLPDTSEMEWLDRHASIWVGGRKQGAFASGTATFTGTAGSIVPSGTLLTSGALSYQTTADITIGAGATSGPLIATVGGVAGNLATGAGLALAIAISGVNGSATVVSMVGGIDAETDDELRSRLLRRIQNPPMGGDATDYEAWALSMPGVTRAWCSPMEMGPGTVTLRFMMDDVNAAYGGFPQAADVAAVASYLNSVRPVSVKDLFVVAPIPEPINFTLAGLLSAGASVQAAVTANVTTMLTDRAAPAFTLNGVSQPAQTIYAAWVSDAVLNTAGVSDFTLTMTDHAMPTAGSLATLGMITYV